MGIKNIIAISIFIICIITISLLTSGGCDLDFGGGGGNDGGNLQSIVQGTIISTPNSGIRVRLSFNGNLPEDIDTTGESGFFSVGGEFDGCLTLRLEFQDSNQDVIAFTNVTVYPEANVDLGSISLENGNVILEDANNITVNFDGNINSTPPTLNTCTGLVNTSEGTIVITRGNTDITVQIEPTTIIEDTNDKDIGCDDLFGNEEVEVTGMLQVNDTVLATIISLK